MKNFTSVHDLATNGTADNGAAIDALVQKALQYKTNPFVDKTLGSNKRIGCLFLNPSMRTRLSTQIAAQNLGMEAIIFNVGSEGWALEFEEEAIMSGNTVEHVKDAAPIFGKYFDILAIRTFPSLKNREDDYSELYINQFIKYAGIPVVSLESATLPRGSGLGLRPERAAFRRRVLEPQSPCPLARTAPWRSAHHGSPARPIARPRHRSPPRPTPTAVRHRRLSGREFRRRRIERPHHRSVRSCPAP